MIKKINEKRIKIYHYFMLLLLINVTLIAVDTPKHWQKGSVEEYYKQMQEDQAAPLDVEGVIDPASLLFYAAENGNTAVVDTILATFEIDINAQDENGDTALMLAVYNDHFETVKRLLRVPEIDINMQNDDGNTALMLAVYEGQYEILDWLLKVP